MHPRRRTERGREGEDLVVVIRDEAGEEGLRAVVPGQVVAEACLGHDLVRLVDHDGRHRELEVVVLDHLGRDPVAAVLELDAELPDEVADDAIDVAKDGERLPAACLGAHYAYLGPGVSSVGGGSGDAFGSRSSIRSTIFPLLPRTWLLRASMSLTG